MLTTSEDIGTPTPSEGGDGDPALDSLLRRLGADPVVTPEPRPGAVVAERYELGAVLGRGGMGVVYAARDRRTGKSVALKWMSLPIRAGAEGRAVAAARFEREARIAARVLHPNLVEVYDVSVTPECPHLVMERLEGETLRARLRRGPLRWDEVIAWLVPAIRGVAALHRAGVVHRDLKPENIFLRRDANDESIVAKVLDLGVSRDLSADGNDLTDVGATLGTPSYMPLEQLRGASSVGPPADVYALGVVLYESLSGARPFDALGASDQAVRLATEHPAPLGSRVRIPAARARVIMRCLARDPSDRPADADALLRELTDADARARGPVVVALVAVATLAVLAIGWVAWTRSGSQPRDTVSSTSPRAHAPSRVELAPPTRPMLTPDVAAAGPSGPTPAATPRAIRTHRTARRGDPTLDRARTLRPEDF